MLKKHFNQSALYLILTFSATWLIWLVAYISSHTVSLNTAFTDWMLRLGTIIPSVTGLVLTYTYRGKRGLKEVLLSLMNFKVSLRWWLYAILLIPLLNLCASGIFLLFNGSLPPVQFPIWFIPLAFVYIIVLMGPLGEEIGWRGFLLNRLLNRWDVVKSGIVLGVIWSAWHIPLFFITGTIQSQLAEIGLWIAIFGYFLYTSCISVLMAILYVGTNGNLFISVFFHGICNLSLGVVPIILTKTGASILVTVLILATAAVVKFFSGTYGNISTIENAD